MDLGLEGKVALVTGGARGIGRAAALALAREGADVAVLARSTAELEKTAGEITALGRRALAVTADATDVAAVDAALSKVEHQLGAPTLLVLGIAAHWTPKKLQFIDDDEVHQLIGTDLTHGALLCKRVLPAMVDARFGRIVALGSLAATLGVAGGTLYAATKAGWEGLIRGLAVDYARRGITANALRIGIVDTERFALREKENPLARERAEKATARRALLTAEEVADVVAFLCSTRASGISGSVVEVTAGAHLNNLW